MAWKVLMITIAVMLSLTTACGREPIHVGQPSQSDPQESQEPPAPDAGPRGAATLFPEQDVQIIYALFENGSRDAAEVIEEWLHDGDRVLSLYQGRPYATWLLLDSGVWRRDPKGGGHLLRYLPPIVADQTWKQMSGDEEIWFRLEGARGNDGGEGWSLTVLNRGEKIRHFFAPDRGPGPLQAVSINYRELEASFRKAGVSSGPGTVSPDERAAYLRSARLDQTPMAPVIEVSGDDFDQALSRLALPVDFDGDGQTEMVLPEGDTVRVLGSTGDLLVETGGSHWTEPEVAVYTMAVDRPLVHVSWPGVCGRNHAANLFLWFSPAENKIVAEAPDRYQTCGNFKHLGNGEFEGTLYLDGRTHATRFRWVKGDLVKQDP